MGYAANVGRVGALAVTLGVGWAVASAPGVAYADTSDSSSSGESSSVSSSARESAKPGRASRSDSDGTADSSPSSGSSAASDSGDDDAASRASKASPRAAGAARDDAEDAEDAEDPADGDESEDTEDTEGTEGTEGTEDTADAVAVSSVATSATPSKPPADAPRTKPAPTTPSPTTTSPAPEPAAAVPQSVVKPPLVSIISDVLASILTPPAKPTPATPLQGATMLASLAAARDELERTAARRYGASVAEAVAQLVDDTPNVLVIGVDGTNLSRVLAHPELTQNFFKLIQGGTTAASTIVGHTTISNPSWSSILTGLWGETTGVVNNVFTPWTYEKWPTLFTQLESLDPSIVTTSIANWDVISAIAATGLGVDNLVNVPEQEDDPLWFKADDLVGDFTEAAIADANAAVANLIFSYFVGVDEAGHAFGGESPEYLEALANFDRNLGEIMAAVDAWEAATGEQWTILMVTDHGHQPQLGFGHGFQSPAETTTFVVANNPDLFQQGGVNLKYSIVDVTATVLDLFGFQPGVTEGVSLLDLDDSTVTPGDDDALLRKALQDAIAMYGYPDIATNLALSVRTIATTIPYYVNNVFNGIQSGLQSLADADIFLISPLAALAIIPVRIIGDLTYIAVNIPAQIIARLTGVTGASIFPLVRPQTPVFPIPEAGDQTPTLLAAACTEGRVTSAVFSCGAAALAS